MSDLRLILELFEHAACGRDARLALREPRLPVL